MSCSNEDKIVIKLEIQIPKSGGQPAVLFDNSAERQKSGIIVPDALTEPAGGLTLTTMSGQICVRGKLNDSNATEVWAKVVPGGTVPPIPTDPASVGATLCTLNSGTGVFEALLVPGVTGYPAANEHTVVAWEKVGPYFFQNDSRHITPIWSPYTECSYPELFRIGVGSKGKPCGSPLKFELLPVRWSVEVKSFAGGDLTRLNECWALRLMTAPNQKVLYCNGGDGVSVPRVQMICESPFAEAWQLRFEVGSSRVTYYLPARQFNQQAQNTFTQAISEVSCDETSIPASVKVYPV